MFKEKDLKAPKADQINGVLDKGCTFEGKLAFDGTVQINGNFSGEICSDGTLIVGNDARVNARIAVDTLVTYGRIEGEINAKTRVEMRVPAVVIATVKTRSLSVEDGVVFEGRCHMEQAGVAASDDVAKEVEEDASEDVLVM